MAAADPVPPPEEVALLELGKVAPATPPDKVPPAPDEHPEDPNATLPWDRCQHSTRDQLELAETKRHSSSKGGREDSEEAALTCPPTEAEDEEAPGLPVMAAHVFVPIDPRCIERVPGGQRHQPTPRPRDEEEEEGEGGHIPPSARPQGPRQKQIFLPIDPPRYRDPLAFEGRAAKPLSEEPRCPCAGERGAGSLQTVASVVGALLLCPCLLYGAYAFLPFDAPLLPSASARLLYALRCATFATVPIVLGTIVVGISRLCSSALEPFGELQREVEIHRTYVSQSTQLFVLFFFNLAVLATYLPQELLKLVPLLTGLFAISRLIFWLSYAIGSSFRAFGFSLTFLPLLAMLLWNLYCMLVLEPQNLLAVAEPKPQDGPKERGAKLRFWG